MEDRPWAEMPRTLKVITQLQLASLLKPFEVKPKQVRFGEVTLKGYTMAMFERAFRYIPLAGFPQNTRNTETTAETKRARKTANVSVFRVGGGIRPRVCLRPLWRYGRIRQPRQSDRHTGRREPNPGSPPLFRRVD